MIVVVGSGMAGMSAAYFLRDQGPITIVEKNSYIGGHTNTIDIQEDNNDVFFDTGFMVFNDVTYPLMIKLFKELGVDSYDTSMSFSVQHRPSGLEYNGSSLNGLFAQRRNMLNFKFIKMLLGVNKFNERAVLDLESGALQGMTIEDYLESLGVSGDVLTKFVAPMSSAVWSTPLSKIGEFPAETLVRFFKNHGFLGLKTQHQWKTVAGGSRQYRNKIMEIVSPKKILGDPAVSVWSEEDGQAYVELSSGQVIKASKVVMACHADESLELLKSPSEKQVRLLSPFKYQRNIATVHLDEGVMPKIKQNWSSWNYVIDKNDESYTVYYMNRLQRIKSQRNYFININGESLVDPSKIVRSIDYTHPLFNRVTTETQKELAQLNERGPIYFTGSYFRYGFHEDALWSSNELCKMILQSQGDLV